MAEPTDSLLARLEHLHRDANTLLRVALTDEQAAEALRGHPLGDLQEAARRLVWCCVEMRRRTTPPGTPLITTKSENPGCGSIV